MPGLDLPDAEDRVNSSGAYGFIFDMCGVEVDDTGRVRIDEYFTMHDAGKRLNPACGFQSIPITHSSANRSLIPVQTDHLFQSQPITDSSAEPITFAVVTGTVGGL